MTEGDVRNLLVRLKEAYETCGKLSHPAVVAISQQLDEVVVDYYRSRNGRTQREEDRLGSKENGRERIDEHASRLRAIF